MDMSLPSATLRYHAMLEEETGTNFALSQIGHCIDYPVHVSYSLHPSSLAGLPAERYAVHVRIPYLLQRAMFAARVSVTS